MIGVQISPVEPEDAEVAGLKEIRGVKVGGYSDDNSPAKAAGIQPGDIIVSADGKPADRVSTLQRIIRGHEPGETVTLEVMRYGERKTFRVKLAEAPAEPSLASRERDEDSVSPAGSMTYDKIGVRVEAVSANPQLASRLSEDQRGVRVVEVDARGPARGRLIPDDIITAVLYPTPRKEVRSVADLQSVLSKLEDGDVVSLLVYDVQRKQTRVANIRVGGR